MRPNHRDYYEHKMSTWKIDFRSQKIFMEKMSALTARRYDQTIMLVPSSCYAVLDRLHIQAPSCHFFKKVSNIIRDK